MTVLFWTGMTVAVVLSCASVVISCFAAQRASAAERHSYRAEEHKSSISRTLHDAGRTTLPREGNTGPARQTPVRFRPGGQREG